MNRAAPGSGSIARRIPYVFGCTHARELPGPLLLALLADLDVDAAAARTALHRLRALSGLSARRVGRVALYRLEGVVWQRFVGMATGAPIQPPTPWTGAFETLVYDVPETARAARDRLRAAAAAAGYAPMRPGVLIGLATPAAEVLAAHPLPPGSLGYAGRLALDPAAAAEAARVAWALDDVRRGYAAATAAIRERARRAALRDTPRDCFRALQECAARAMVARLPDPELPEQLTGPWPRAELVATLDSATARLQQGAIRHAHDVVAAHPLRDLVTSIDWAGEVGVSVAPCRLCADAG